MSKICGFLTVVFILIGVTPLFASAPSFQPDTVMDGLSLNGWHTFGQADWHAAQGEIVGTPGQAGKGGWLVLDHSYQDSALFTEFRCASGGVTGILLRAEKTDSGGLKGVYVSLSDPDLQAYSVTIDAQGQILERNKLWRGGGLVRVAPPPSPDTGVGSDVLAVDLNQDGAMDIVTATRFGTFIYWGKAQSGKLTSAQH